MGVPPRLRSPYALRAICLAALLALSSSHAQAQKRPILTAVNPVLSSDEIQLQVQISGGVPAATQVRFTGQGRVMVLEIAGVENRAERRNIPLRDPRLKLVTIETLPGGVQILLEAGDTPAPFAGHILKPTLVPSGLIATVWQAGAAPVAVIPPGGLPYTVSEIELVYAKPHPDNPPLGDIARTQVTLGVGPDGFVAPREGLPTKTFALTSVPRPNRVLPTGIRTISEAIVKAFNARGLAGVFVQPHPEDIDLDSSRDLRRDRTKLRLLVWTGRLLEFRTFASGPRIPEDESIDNPAHARIKSESPVQPGDLLVKEKIDEYVARMNRHPGRVIDTSLSSAGEPGGAYLDYLVNDTRPWAAYFQLANTGTKGTSDLRERFGFTHNQLTNRDDILQLDYITGDFQSVHAFFGSYDVPLLWDNRVRLKTSGSYVEYDAEQLGVTSVLFQGDQWNVRTELTGTVWQHDAWFVDVYGGFAWQSVSVDNEIAAFKLGGDADFLLPVIGVRVERRTPEIDLGFDLSNHWNIAAIAGTKGRDLSSLGRRAADNPNFEVLRFNATASLYVDALLADADSPTGVPLVHELFFQARGQYAWGNELAPQFQDVGTGYYAVRGYEQSVTAGDDLYLGRFEYRLHLPRLLPVDPSPFELPWGQEFEAQPAQPNGIPDWDFVVRAFVDAGYTFINDRTNFDFNETMVSAGGGVELQISRHFVFSFDYGVALKSLKNGEGDAGDGKAHLVGTILY